MQHSYEANTTALREEILPSLDELDPKGANWKRPSPTAILAEWDVPKPSMSVPNATANVTHNGSSIRAFTNTTEHLQDVKFVPAKINEISLPGLAKPMLRNILDDAVEAFTDKAEDATTSKVI